MVKDESDIIATTIGHLDASGVDGIIVADNLSTDGTMGILNKLKPKCELIVRRDNEIAYYQSTKMTLLAQTAFGEGADWVIPFDADELWYSTKGTLHEALESLDGDCAHAQLYNYFPTHWDNPQEPNPILRINHRDPTPSPLTKVAVRRRSDVVVEQGNHGAHATGDRPLRHQQSSLRVAHFPWRSYRQYERKIRNGAAAYALTDLSEDEGAHWRQHGRLLNREGTGALRMVFETHFVDPEIDLEYAPAPLAWPRS